MGSHQAKELRDNDRVEPDPEVTPGKQFRISAPTEDFGSAGSVRQEMRPEDKGSQIRGASGQNDITLEKSMTDHSITILSGSSKSVAILNARARHEACIREFRSLNGKLHQ